MEYIVAFQNFLYTESNILDVLERYISELLSFKEMQSTLHANKLTSYHNMIMDKDFLKELRDFFNELYDMIDKKHPELNFSIAGRRKDLLSFEKKILQYLELNKSLDFIRDIYAFRIILFGNTSLDLIKHCYLLAENIIELAATKGFTPCGGLPLIGISEESTSKIPYYSSFKYNQFTKDYITYKKENGYQGLHLTLIDVNGRPLEIQIRTLEMHAFDESGDASHIIYKKKKYGKTIPLERDKITIQGYTYVNDQVFDFAGIEKPIFIFQRQKTF